MRSLFNVTRNSAAISIACVALIVHCDASVHVHMLSLHTTGPSFVFASRVDLPLTIVTHVRSSLTSQQRRTSNYQFLPGTAQYNVT